ncbi:MAG: hypothetical protein HGA87_00010 [Desulfobulbaceae bacterium]|nr:hypothetical protein [Desulfobulbaceae bacterium]
MSDYIKVTFETLADGSFKITGSEKLRELDPEVARVFDEDYTPRISEEYLYDGAGKYERLLSGSIFSPETKEWIKTTCAAASKRLAEIEEQVFRLQENPVTETISISGYSPTNDTAGTITAALDPYFGQSARDDDDVTGEQRKWITAAAMAASRARLSAPRRISV